MPPASPSAVSKVSFPRKLTLDRICTIFLTEAHQEEASQDHSFESGRAADEAREV